jgi:hypothetical protein
MPAVTQPTIYRGNCAVRVYVINTSLIYSISFLVYWCVLGERRLHRMFADARETEMLFDYLYEQRQLDCRV